MIQNLDRFHINGIENDGIIFGRSSNCCSDLKISIAKGSGMKFTYCIRNFKFSAA